jgi:hypothetical protein
MVDLNVWLALAYDGHVHHRNCFSNVIRHVRSRIQRFVKLKIDSIK